ncbi:MAG: hypothetical protein ACKVQW_11865, partial [Pyrinomonadaceae bacterium]
MRRKLFVVALAICIGFLVSLTSVNQTAQGKVGNKTLPGSDLINNSIPLYGRNTGDERLRPSAVPAVQDIRDGLSRPDSGAPLPNAPETCLPAQSATSCPRCSSSGIAPDDCADDTFVVDCGGGLDTG